MKIEFRVTANPPENAPNWSASLTRDFSRNAELQLHGALTRYWPLIPWRVNAVTPSDGPPSVALTTGDPRFDPKAPLTVNGFRFVPGPPVAMLDAPPVVMPPEPPDTAPVPSWSTCRPGRREGDEYVCPKPGCGVRWSIDEERPRCPN